MGSSPKVCAKQLAVPVPSPDRASLSWSCATLQSLCRRSPAPAWVGCSPHALLLALGFRVFTTDGAPAPLAWFGGILSWACALLQSPSSRQRPPHAPATKKVDGVDSATAFLEVLRPFSVSPLAAAASWTGLPHPAACVLRFSRPLDAFIRREPTGLVSCRIRSWGCALQSFSPLVQPHAVSGAAPLLPLDEPERPRPASSRGTPKHTEPTRPTGPTRRPKVPRPPASPRSRAAAPAEASTTTETGDRPFDGRRNTRVHASAEATASCAPPERSTWGRPRTPRPKARRTRSRSLRERPRLQGFAPHESPPLGGGLLHPISGAWLSWASCPPGSSLSPACDGLHRRSPHGLSRAGRKRPERRPSRVSPPASTAGLRRDCRPSWASPPPDRHERWKRSRFGSRLLELRGASPSPSSSL
jgi:hypothetical protein